MAKKILTQNSVDVDNVQSLADQPTETASELKQTFDKTGTDIKSYNNNTLLVELQSETPNDSGANAIGTEGTFGTNNVADEIKAIKVVTDGKIESGDAYLKTETYSNVEIDAKDTVLQNQIDNKAELSDVYLKAETYNKTETDSLLNQKAEISNVLEKDNSVLFSPVGDYNPATKKYADDLAIAGIPLYNPLEFYQVDATGTTTQGSSLPTDNKENIDIARTSKEASGTVDAIAVITDGTFDYAKDGNTITFIPSGNNTGAVTISFDGQSVVNLLKPDELGGTTALVADDIVNGIPITVIRRVTGDFFLLAPKGKKLIGDAQPENVLVGKTFSNFNGNDKIGTMPNRGNVLYSLPINGTYTIQEGYHSGSGQINQSVPVKTSQTYTPGTTNQIISAGQYLSGIQTILGDTDLIASNITKTKNIFNVTGTAPRYAEGNTFTGTGGSFSVTGLDFTPSKAIISVFGSGSGKWFISKLGIQYPSVNNIAEKWQGGGALEGGEFMTVPISAFSGGFSGTFPAIAGITVGSGATWWAIE